MKSTYVQVYLEYSGYRERIEALMFIYAVVHLKRFPTQACIYNFAHHA